MNEKPKVLVDSECAFCNKSVAFIIEHGGESDLDFLSLYSDEGKQLLKKHGLPQDYNKSLVLIEDGKLYLKLDAALKIARRLDGIWPVFYYFRFVPRFIRDAVYDIISRHRHKLI